MYLNELIKLLEEQVEDPDPQMILRALDFLPVGSPPEVILMAKEEITLAVEKLRVALPILIRKYTRDGRIIVPPRPIQGIELEPDVSLIFGNHKSYGGNPLALFKDHPEVYEGMSRTELYNFDQLMYRALLRARQLKQAIPQKLAYGRSAIKKPTPQKVIDDILGSFKEGVISEEQLVQKLSKTRKVVGGDYKRPGLFIIDRANSHVEIVYV